MPRKLSKLKAKAPKIDKTTVDLTTTAPKRAYSKREEVYTVELGERVCDLVSGGSNLHRISLMQGEGFPSSGTMYRWCDQHPEFASKYARARENRADARAERIDEITEQMIRGEIKPDVARVAIDAMKWQAGKEMPRRYGEKLTLDGDLKLTQSDDQLDSRLAHLMVKAGAASGSRIH